MCLKVLIQQNVILEARKSMSILSKCMVPYVLMIVHNRVFRQYYIALGDDVFNSVCG